MMEINKKALMICWLIIANLALFFSLFGNFWCHFAQRTATDYNNDEETIVAGIWSLKDNVYGGCYRWSFTGLIPDPSWNAAKTFSILTVVVGGASIVTIMLGDGNKKMWLTVSVLSSCSLLFQACTFVIFQSYICTEKDIDMTGSSKSYQKIDKCQRGPGAGMAIFAAVLWGISGAIAIYSNVMEQKELHSSSYPPGTSKEMKEFPLDDHQSLGVLSGSTEVLQQKNLPEQAVVNSNYGNP